MENGLSFKLSQHEYNTRLLYFIKSQLGVGIINKETKTKMVIIESEIETN